MQFGFIDHVICLDEEDDRLIYGLYAYFGIIDCIDDKKDYSEYGPNQTYHDVLREYNCVGIADNIIDGWWPRLMTMKSYCNKLSCPYTALARWSRTLIPPESLDLFRDIIINDTDELFTTECPDDIAALLKVIDRAQAENKYVIHFGV